MRIISFIQEQLRHLVVLKNVVIIYCLAAAIAVLSFSNAYVALADPVLDVSVSSGVVLLGGQASYTITVENTDSSDKGYNLSFSSVFSSSRTNPQGQVTFYSASDSRGSLAPTSVVTNTGNGDTTIDFINIKDLAANETYTFNLVVDMSGDVTWEAMDDLIHDITATVNTMPDGSGLDIANSASDTSDVMPIALVEKIVNQSTGVEQATGTIDRPYSYSIRVQNNYTNATDNVIVTDTLPDGIEFLGITSVHACTNSRSNITGITTISCNLGTMAASAEEIIEFDAGIRYDYFGTGNGGTNRNHDDFDGTPALGAPIINKTNLVNHVDLDGEYQGSAIATQSDDAPVTAAYSTVSKSGNVSNGGNGDRVDYTIIYTTSEYYDIIDDNTDDNNSSITIHDHLPDGQTYITTPAPNPTPTSVVINGDGTTDIYWNSAVLNNLAHSSSFAITFSATIDSTWNDGSPIVAADSMSNSVDSHGEWDDQTDLGRANGITNSSASAYFEMAVPPITKEVEDPNNPGTWLDATEAVVGDNLKFRVRFNTNDGANPVVANIKLGDITVTDWLPKGMSYVAASAVESYSAPGDFTDGGNPEAETAVTIGSLNGVEWDLGDVAQAGWWQAIFTARVEDVVTVISGAQVNNIWKMSGVNSNGSEYSDRDMVGMIYRNPHLLLNKTMSNSPNPLKPGDNVEYTVTIQNTGDAPAKDLLFKDIVDEYMNDITPTVTSIDLNGTNLVSGTDYLTPTFNSGTHEFTIDFNDGVIETNIPVGETLTIIYQATIDNDTGAGRWVHNTATSSCNTQDDGSGRAILASGNIADDNTDHTSMGLPDITSSKSVSAGPYAIGDVITYTIDTTIPQGQVAFWPEIIDSIDMDGIVYQVGSAVLSNISGTPVTSAAFDAATNPNPIVDLTGNNSSEFLWYFNNPIDNRGQATDYVFRLTFNVQYTGLEDDGTSWEFFIPTNGDEISNFALFNWANYSAGARTTNSAAFTTTVAADIDQPLLATDKTVTSVGPYVAGSAIDYQVIITNNGQATAYDITWEDDIEVSGGATLSSVTHSASGALVSGTGFLEDFTGDPLTMDFDGGTSDTNLAPGEFITIQYSVIIGGDIGAGASIGNIADVDWSSRDGIIIGERVYGDTAQESAYTSDTDSASVTSSTASITKTIVTPASGEAEIGEIVTYQLHITVPAETVLYSPTIQDVINQDGMQYVNSSTVINDVSGNPETAATVTAAPVIDNANPNPGSTVTFTFDNSIDNANSGAPTGDTDYVFNMTYQMVATAIDDGSNWIINPNDTVNTATLHWDDGGTSRSISDNSSLVINNPHLTVVKNFDTETAAGGDTVTATVVITNDGDGTSYESDGGTDFTDTMPAGFTNPQLISINHSTNGNLTSPADYTFTTSGNDFTIEYNSAQTDLAPGETLTITYTTDIEAGIGAGIDIANNVDVDYSSMSGVQAGERIYDDTNPAEDNADTASDNITTAAATMTKATSLGAGTAAIGENFSYTITVDIPSNTTIYNGEITDTVPDGFTVTSTSASPNVGTITAVEQANGTTPVTWNMGDISNNPNAQAVLTINVRVDNDYSDASLLDGLPAGLDGDGQDTITNAGAFRWEDADIGGAAHNLNDNITVTITEPHPTISKSVNNSTAGIGDTMIYTVVLANDGTSTLYNINWDDTLPAELFDAGTSPSLTSVTHSVNNLLTSGTDYSANFGVNPATVSFNTATETTLAPGESVTIIYTAIVENTVSAGDNLINNTRITFAASQPNSNPNRRSYQGSDSETITIATTSIGDKVWYDNNSDGIQDAGEEGIRNISVHLLDGVGNPIDDPLNPGTPYIAQTNTSGEYLFVNLTAGNYQVHFDNTGYSLSPQNQGGDDNLDSDISTATGTTSPFTLAHGEHITHTDAGFIPASIGNLVWVDTNGNGIQNIGEPVQGGIIVRLLDDSGSPVDNPLNPGTPYVATTNGSGEYSFENLIAGNYQVQIDIPVGYKATLQDQVGSEAVDSDVNASGRSDTIVLMAGETNSTVDVGLYQPVDIGNKVWRDDNADGIQDVGEPGLENVEVILLDEIGNSVDNPNNPGHPYIVYTNSNGDYLFDNLIPGSYIVDFVPPNNYVISPKDVGIIEADDSDADIVTHQTDIFAVDSGDSEEEIDAGMYHLASIGDKVWRDDERDGIQADWELGLENVTVELLDGSNNPVDEPGNPGTPYTIITGITGDYLFQDLTPGAYRIRVILPADHNPSDKNQGGDNTKDSDINIGTLTTDTVTIISGENNTTIDAGIYALYANVFDPPSAVKTVTASGESEIEWKMVWINDGNMVAINTQITDDIPTGTTYSPGSVMCDARGTSVTTICTYDVVLDRVRWEGDIDFDIGGTTEDNSLNEVVITYRTTVPATMKTVENQASANWDENGDGSFTDDILGGQTPTLTRNPSNAGATVWTRIDRKTGDASIGNTIWLDSNSNGKQDDGEPGLENIRIKLLDDKGRVVARTDTSHNGHYKFENLPKGKYKVVVKKEDVAQYIQTYDPDRKMDGKGTVHLRNKQHYTKGDFGYSNQELILAKTGMNWFSWWR